MNNLEDLVQRMRDGANHNARELARVNKAYTRRIEALEARVKELESRKPKFDASDLFGKGGFGGL